MDDTQVTKSPRWIVATTCGAFVLLVVVGGLFAMRDQLLAQMRADGREQTREREKLGRRIDALQSTLDTLATQPKADEAARAAITSSLAEIDTSIATLNERVDQLEKHAEEKKAEPVAAAPVVVAAPVAPSPSVALEALHHAAASEKPFAEELAAWAKLHPEAEKTTTALHDVAIVGIANDATLRQQLREAIEIKPAATLVDDTSLMGKLNTHLKGLVRIKKMVADPYATLRTEIAQADIPSLIAHAEQLSDADRAPLATWLATAQAAQTARAALATLTPLAEH